MTNVKSEEAYISSPPPSSSFWANASQHLTTCVPPADDDSIPSTPETCSKRVWNYLHVALAFARSRLWLVSGVAVLFLLATALVSSPSLRYALRGGLPRRNVAFIGNSIIYFYDLPRTLSTFSGGRIQQNSCLAGAGSLANMETKQNGMWNRWRSDSAILTTTDDDAIDNGCFDDNVVWDFGACSMEMLLFGHDVDQAQAEHDEWWEYREEQHIKDDDAWTASGEGDRDPRQTNPCMQSQAYLNFLASLPLSDIRRSVPQGSWDFLVLDDRTAGPRLQENRDTSLAALQDTFLPLIQESKVTPLLLVTSAYWTHRDADDDANDNTFQNITYWSVQTYEGYKQYANYLRKALPRSQRPRLVNMDVAFLVVYEEDLDLWYSLYWVDDKHPSPHGAFLQNCLLHHAVYGVLPKRSIVLLDDMESLWDNARTLMYPRDATVPFPTREEAEYLYDVCHRVAHGYIPPSFKKELRSHGLSLF